MKQVLKRLIMIHLICTNCGAIKEFHHSDVSKIIGEISEELGFEENGYSFTIFGKCLNSKNCKGYKDK